MIDENLPFTPYERPEWLDKVKGSGDYPWDHWKDRALTVGIPEKLAQLGRDVMREAFNHSWSIELQNECGWNDDGVEMIEFAKRDPAAAAQRWEHLLRTDGERI